MSIGSFSGSYRGEDTTNLLRNMSSGFSSAGTQLATLQTPSSIGTAANQADATANVPGINQIEMPSWLKSPDSNIQELLKSYGGVQAAFDPTDQVNARNDAIGYNTSAGGQAANNAATEYANRASQSGASSLGAGVVKAQSMMPVLQQNAALRTDAADVAAKAHQEGASLASQIAGTIGQLRQSYLSTLTGYATGQQELALNRYQVEQQVAGNAAQTGLGYAQLQQKSYQDMMDAQMRDSEQARLAATTTLGIGRPDGSYTLDNAGAVLSGQADYDKMRNWQASQTRAQQALAGMF